MPINNVISVSRFSPECSFSKTITIADKGYESEPIYIANYSVVGINLPIPSFQLLFGPIETSPPNIAAFEVFIASTAVLPPL